MYPTKNLKTENLKGKVSKITTINEDASCIGNSSVSFMEKTIKDFDRHGNLIKSVRIDFFGSYESSTSDTVTEILKYEKNKILERIEFNGGNADYSKNGKMDKHSYWKYDSINNSIKEIDYLRSDTLNFNFHEKIERYFLGNNYFRSEDTLSSVTHIKYYNSKNEVKNYYMIIGKDTIPIIYDVIFNSKGQKIQDTHKYGKSTYSYSYNSLGHLIKIQDKNRTTVYVRDKIGLILNEKTYEIGDGGYSVDKSYKYDSQSNLVEEKSILSEQEKKIYQYKYDTHGNYILKKSEFWSFGQYVNEGITLRRVTTEKREIEYYN